MKLRHILKFFRRPIVVPHYTVKKTDLQKAREAKHRQLADETGLPNPLRMK